MESVFDDHTERPLRLGSADVFMQARKLSVPNGQSMYVSVTELELSASHTLDRNHLDPSCPACRRLHAQLEVLARSAVRCVELTDVNFEVYSSPARIVCSPADGHRPSVTVSIYAWDLSGASASESVSSAISEIQEALAACGVRKK